MPSFRDLKGREVEDVVDSRTFPALPDPGVEVVERGEIKAAMEKAAANRPRRERDRVRVLDEGERFVPSDERAPLPEDFEAGLRALASTLDEIHVASDRMDLLVVQATEQMEALRARAQQDADKVAKFSAALKLLQQADEQ